MAEPKTNLLETLKERVLLADGAMGTQLQERGLEHGACGELWNKAYPDRVRAIHQAYREAGADLILTNTFGGNLVRLAGHQCAQFAYELNYLGAQLAREAAGASGFVLGDIGPLGEFLEPIGDLTKAQAVEAFEPQAQAFADAKTDAILIETMSALDEAECAIEAVRNVAKCPIFLSFTFEVSPAGIHTMTGATPEDVARFATDWGVAVVGTNCGRNLHMQDYVAILERMRNVTSLPLMVQPNAGAPVLSEGKTVYRETHEKMAEWIDAFVAAGAQIVGGCCGTTPAHIREFRRVLDQKA